MVADRGFDIYIEKKYSKSLPDEYIYLASASKSVNFVERGFFDIYEKIKTAASCSLISKKADAKEISVKIFNTVMNAISSLEKKIGL